MAFEWILFLTALVCFLALHLYLLDWPSTRRYHWMGLLIWLCAAAMYNLVIWDRLGSQGGKKWLCGYFLELVFSMENVFIFHIIIEAFKMPKSMAQKALFIVVCCQVVFQMVFFMGLADLLQSIKVLPYLLGLWLLGVAYETSRKDGHDDAFDASTMTRAFKACLGDRLSWHYHDTGGFLTREMEGGALKVTMLGPAVACLLLADFVMEVDVSLTKIEAIENHYIAFTSSVAAAFAMPELFFVARDLFARYALLKYGITFVLVYFGAELLLHQIVHIPDMIGIAVIVLVLGLCVLISTILESRQEASELGIEEASKQADDATRDTRLPAIMLQGPVSALENHEAKEIADCLEGVKNGSSNPTTVTW